MTRMDHYVSDIPMSKGSITSEFGSVLTQTGDSSTAIPPPANPTILIIPTVSSVTIAA